MIVSGVVVRCRPEHRLDVCDAVGAIEWAEVHHEDPLGRLVVTVEARDANEAAARLRHLQGLPGVLSADLAQLVEC